jgi:transposase
MSRMKKARVFDREFKLKAVQRMLRGENVSALARELQVRRKLLYEWRENFRRGGSEYLRGRGRPKADAGKEPVKRTELEKAKRRIAELERKIGQQELEIDFFETALQRIEQRQSHAAPSTPSSARRRYKAK